MQLARIGIGEPHDADEILYELEDDNGMPIVSDDETFAEATNLPAYQAALATMTGAVVHPEFVETGYILRIRCVPEQRGLPLTIPLN